MTRKARVLAWLLSLGVAGALFHFVEPSAAERREVGVDSHASGVTMELLDQFGGDVRAVTVRLPYAYVGVGPRLVVVDVSDPGALRQVGQSAVMPDIVDAVVVAGDLAFVAAGEDGGLRIFGISDPLHPAELGAADTPGSAQDVSVIGRHAYVADGVTGGLRIFDVSDPLLPHEVGAIDTPGGCGKVVARGDHAYVADSGNTWLGDIRQPGGYGMFRIYDVANPAEPREVSAIRPGPSPRGIVRSLALDGDRAYVGVPSSDPDLADVSGLAVIDISRPDTPRVSAFCPIGDMWSSFPFVVTSEDRLFTGAVIVDISDPDAPRILGPGLQGVSLVVAGRRAYLASRGGMLLTYDVTPAEGPVRLGELRWPVDTQHVAVSLGATYMTDEGGFWILAAAAPGRIRPLGYYEAPIVHSLGGIAVEGETAYLLENRADTDLVEIIDVSNPQRPSTVGFYAGGSGLSNISVEEDYAYLIEASDFPRMHVVDMSRPTHPRQVGSLIGLHGEALVVDGDYAYVATRWTCPTGLLVLDLHDRRRPKLATWYPLSGSSLALRDGILYLLSHERLRVLDAGQPPQLQEIGGLDLPEAGAGMVLWRDYVIVAAGTAGLVAVDVSDATRPLMAGRLETPGLAADVALHGDLLWVADQRGGAVTIRLAETEAQLPTSEATSTEEPSSTPRRTSTRQPTRPRYATPTRPPMTPGPPTTTILPPLSGRTSRDGPQATREPPGSGLTLEIAGHLGGVTRAVDAADGYVYAGMGASVSVVDVADPDAPVTVSETVLMPDLVHDVAVVGNRLLVAAGEGGLWILDVSDPTHPTVVATADTPGGALSVASAGLHAYVAAGLDGVRIFDMRDECNPAEVGAIPAADEILDVVADSGLAYVADGKAGLRLFDVAAPAQPELMSELDTPGTATRLDVDGSQGLAYVADAGGGLQIVDVAAPERPVLIGSLPQPEFRVFGRIGTTLDVDVRQGVAYLAGSYLGLFGGSGVRVADVTDSTSPTEIGFSATPGRAAGIVLAGDHAYVAAGEGGLQVLDISQPDQLVEDSFVETLGSVVSVRAHANLLYASDRQPETSTATTGLYVVDASDPASLVMLNRYPELGGAKHVSRADASRAYLSGGYDTLRVLDWLGLTQARGVARETRFTVESTAPAGELLLAAGGDDGLHVFRLTDDLLPRWLATLPVEGAAAQVAAMDELAYVAAGEGGLRVIDISEPQRPRELAAVPEIHAARSVALSDGAAYVADATAGVWVVDVGDPTQPQVTRMLQTSGNPEHVALSGDQLWVADGAAGVHLFDLSTPDGPSLVTSRDTPGRAQCVELLGDAAYVAAGEAGLLAMHLTSGSHQPTATPSAVATPGYHSVYLPAVDRRLGP